jgi:hypothetical protein
MDIKIKLVCAECGEDLTHQIQLAEGNEETDVITVAVMPCGDCALDPDGEPEE